MLKIIRERIRQGHRTGRFPEEKPALPERFRGLPEIDPSFRDDSGGAGRCPFGALETVDGRPRLDMGLCLFCAECPCASSGVRFTREYSLASRTREGLRVGEGGFSPAAPLDREMKRLFGRSLKLRQVSAGGCNGCEADVNVLSTLVFDMGRFGIQFVASPRHADGILVTGPVTANMKSALLDTWNAVPAPRLVIAAGACAIGGGPFRGSAEASDGLGEILPVDLYIPGCPPHPYTTLDGLLRLLGRLQRS